MKIAFLYAGQGSQSVGMGKDIFDAYSSVRNLFNEASSIIGRDIADIIFNGPQESLNETINTQISVFLVSYSYWKIFSERYKIQPYAMCGLSLGEYTALLCAGVLNFKDTLTLLHLRSKFMQEACNLKPGSMASIIGLSASKVKEICATVSEKFGLVVVANINSHEQIVISGEIQAVDEAIKVLQQSGAKKVIKLKVAGAFHSPLMSTAQDKLNPYIEKVNFNAPLCPVISNVTGLPTLTGEEIKTNLAKQIISPTLWLNSMLYLLKQGVDFFIEFGPGNVLTNLIKRIAECEGMKVKTTSINSLPAIENFSQTSSYT